MRPEPTLAGAHVGQQGTSFPGSRHPLSYGTHAQAHTHTHTHINYTGHTYTAMYTHTPSQTYTHVACGAARSWELRTDHRQPFPLGFNDTASAQRGICFAGFPAGWGQGSGRGQGWAGGRGLWAGRWAGPLGTRARPAQLPPSLRPALSAGIRPQGAVPTELGTTSPGATEDLVSRPRSARLEAWKGEGKLDGMAGNLGSSRICTRCPLSREPGPAQALVNPVSPWRLSGGIQM